MREPVAADPQRQFAYNTIAIPDLSPDRIASRRFEALVRRKRRRPMLACLICGLTPHQRYLRKVGLLVTNRKPRVRL